MKQKVLVCKAILSSMGQNTRLESKQEMAGEGKVRSWLDVVKGKKESTKQGNKTAGGTIGTRHGIR